MPYKSENLVDQISLVEQIQGLYRKINAFHFLDVPMTEIQARRNAQIIAPATNEHGIELCLLMTKSKAPADRELVNLFYGYGGGGGPFAPFGARRAMGLGKAGDSPAVRQRAKEWWNHPETLQDCNELRKGVKQVYRMMFRSSRHGIKELLANIDQWCLDIVDIPRRVRIGDVQRIEFDSYALKPHAIRGQLLNLLLDPGFGSRLEKCASPECDAFFLQPKHRSGQRKYCPSDPECARLGDNARRRKKRMNQ